MVGLAGEDSGSSFVAVLKAALANKVLPGRVGADHGVVARGGGGGLFAVSL